MSDKLQSLIAKIRMLIYTNRGEVLGEPELGLDLESYLFEENMNDGVIRDRFYAQLAKYVPEHIDHNVDCTVDMQSDGVRNTGIINISIDDKKILGIRL